MPGKDLSADRKAILEWTLHHPRGCSWEREWGLLTVTKETVFSNGLGSSCQRGGLAVEMFCAVETHRIDAS